MATTFDTIRSQQMTLIEAITPTSHAGKPFRRHRDAELFTEFVAREPHGCFRRFEILRNFDDEQLPTSDGSLEGCRHTMELRVAYPMELGLYGPGNERDLERVMDEDRRSIDAAIGLNGSAGYVANLDDCHFVSLAVVAADRARFLSFTYSLLYDRSV